MPRSASLLWPIWLILLALTACSEGQIFDANNSGTPTNKGQPGTMSTAGTMTNLGTATSDPMTTLTTTRANQAPQAVILVGGEPALVGKSLALDGSASNDPERQALSYRWRIVQGAATLTGGDEPRASVVATATGVVVVGLVVTDAEGAMSQEAEATVSVEAPRVNRAPVAVATALPLMGLTAAPITLDASGSMDPDGDPLTMVWSLVQMPQGSKAVIADDEATVTSFTPDLPGIYEVAVIVSDSEAEDATTLTLSIREPNHAPIAILAPPGQAVVGSSVALDASGSHDLDGGTLAFLWSVTQAPAMSNAVIVPGAGGLAAFLPQVPGDYVISVTVSDAAGLADSARVTFKVVPPPNTPPMAAAGADQTVVLGATVTLDGSGSQDLEDTPAGMVLQGIWMLRSSPAGAQGVLSNPMALTTSFVPGKEGVYRFMLTVQDSGGASASDEVVVVVTPRPNTAPVAVIGGPVSERARVAVTFDGFASSDVEDDLAGLPLSYHWTLVSQPQGSAASLGTPYAPSASLLPLVGGVYTLKLTVTDAQGLAHDASASVTVLNDSPLARAGADQVGDVGMASQFGAGASGDLEDDAEGVALGYSWRIDAAPTGSLATLIASGTKTTTLVPDLPGTYELRLTVTDSGGASAWDTVILTVRAPNTAPVARAGADVSGWRGQQIVVDGSGSSDTEDDALGVALAYSWTLVSSPTGSTPTIGDGDKPQAWLGALEYGEYELELKVTDSLGRVHTDRVVVTIECVLISEVLEGSSNNKVLEIANCGNQMVDLVGLHICQINNANQSCTPSKDFALQGTLTPGQTFLMCNTNLDQTILPTGASCDVFEASVMTFNGNDRLLLYHEESGAAGFQSTGDRRLDAFGQESVDPGLIWADTTYTRCDTSYYDGIGSFATTLPAWAALGTINDASGLGVAFSGCP